MIRVLIIDELEAQVKSQLITNSNKGIRVRVVSNIAENK